MGSLSPGKALGQEAGLSFRGFPHFLLSLYGEMPLGPCFAGAVWIDSCNGRCWAVDVVSTRKARCTDAG